MGVVVVGVTIVDVVDVGLAVGVVVVGVAIVDVVYVGVPVDVVVVGVTIVDVVDVGMPVVVVGEAVNVFSVDTVIVVGVMVVVDPVGNEPELLEPKNSSVYFSISSLIKKYIHIHILWLFPPLGAVADKKRN